MAVRPGLFAATVNAKLPDLLRVLEYTILKQRCTVQRSQDIHTYSRHPEVSVHHLSDIQQLEQQLSLAALWAQHRCARYCGGESHGLHLRHAHAPCPVHTQECWMCAKDWLYQKPQNLPHAVGGIGHVNDNCVCGGAQIFALLKETASEDESCFGPKL